MIELADLFTVYGGSVRILFDQAFNFQLAIVRQFEAVGPEQFDSVIGVGIVRRGDHDAQIGAHGAGQHADGGRGTRADQTHIHAGRGESAHHGVFDHIARQSGVLADDDHMSALALADEGADGPAQLQGDFGGHGRLVRPTADAVSAKILFHGLDPRAGYGAEVVG